MQIIKNYNQFVNLQNHYNYSYLRPVLWNFYSVSNEYSNYYLFTKQIFMQVSLKSN